MKKYINKLYKLLAFFPIFFTVFILVFSGIALILSIPPISEIVPRSCLPIVFNIILAVISIGGIYFFKYEKEKKCKILCLTFIIFIISLIFQTRTNIKFAWSSISFLGLSLTLYTILKYSAVLKKQRNYLENSRNALAFLNSFDVILFITFRYIYSRLAEIDAFLSNNYAGLYNWFIEDENEWIVYLSLLSFILFIPAMIRLLGIWFYKKQLRIEIDKDNTLFTAYCTFYIISLVQICLYLGVVLGADISEPLNILSLVFLLSIYMVTTVFFWLPIYEWVNQRGQRKIETLSNWILGLIVFVLLVLLDYSESSAIAILSWFIPILIYEFIGKLHTSPRMTRKYSRFEVKTTKKFESHLYYISLLSFMTLLVMNIISSLATVQIVKNGEIVEINTIQEYLSQVIINVSPKSSGNVYQAPYRLLSSTIIVFLSMMVSILLSNGVMWLLERWYIDDGKGYFEIKSKEENSNNDEYSSKKTDRPTTDKVGNVVEESESDKKKINQRKNKKKHNKRKKNK